MMQNVYSLTSKIHVFVESQHCFKIQSLVRLKANSELKTPVKPKNITYFQYTMAKNVHYHSKREELGHSEEILYQSKNETQQGKQ